MPANYKEIAFESAIEQHLLANGYIKGNPDTFDSERAFDPDMFLDFVKETQPDKWAALEKLHGASTADTVLEELCKSLDSRGSLDVIRHGFKCYGKLIEVAFFRPAHGLNPEIIRLYEANKLTVTRQLHFSHSHPQKSIDTVLSLNGVPVVTAELKNPMSGQTVNHAVHQYRNDRDPREPIFQFKKRALVHFAVDPDLAYMTTKLAGDSTFFLPFNLGFNYGAGNPERPGKHRTWYLWEQVWQRDSLLDIIGGFLHLEVKERLVGGNATRAGVSEDPCSCGWGESERLKLSDLSQGSASVVFILCRKERPLAMFDDPSE